MVILAEEEEDVRMILWWRCLYESVSVHVCKRGGVIMTVGGRGLDFISDLRPSGTPREPSTSPPPIGFTERSTLLKIHYIT